MSAFEALPSRVKYYLLDYKDRNLEDFRSKYGTGTLRGLSREQLKEVFESATTQDKLIL